MHIAQAHRGCTGFRRVVSVQDSLKGCRVSSNYHPRPLGGSENYIPYIEPLYPLYNPYILSHMVLGDLFFRSFWGSGMGLWGTQSRTGRNNNLLGGSGGLSN